MYSFYKKSYRLFYTMNQHEWLLFVNPALHYYMDG